VEPEAGHDPEMRNLLEDLSVYGGTVRKRNGVWWEVLL
jgi:hypothetical protein